MKYNLISESCIPETYGGDSNIAEIAMNTDSSVKPTVYISEDGASVVLMRKLVDFDSKMGYACSYELTLHSPETIDELLPKLVDNFEAYIQTCNYSQSNNVKILNYENYKIIRNQNK